MSEDVLVIGGTSLVGSRFVELYPNQRQLITPGHSELDVTDAQKVAMFISKYHPQTIVNFAAYTNVAEAENQRGDKAGDCWRVNVGGVANIVSTLTDEFLVQVSTDMVFPGSIERPGPYLESDEADMDSAKVTWYGFSKGEAERLVKDKGAILRLIYPVRARFEQKLDYLRKLLRLFNQGSLYPVFTDQQVSVTFIDEACMALQQIVKRQIKGVFHASSRDITTPYGLVCYLLKKLGKDTSSVQRSSIESVSNPVRYPKYGGLRIEETEKELGVRFSTWKGMIDKLVEQGITV